MLVFSISFPQVAQFLYAVCQSPLNKVSFVCNIYLVNIVQLGGKYSGVAKEFFSQLSGHRHSEQAGSTSVILWLTPCYIQIAPVPVG